MSDTDQMTDSAELHELRDSLSGVALPERPRLEAITARGRARRRQRLSRAAGVSVAGVAAGTALAFGLSGAHGSASVPGTIRTLAPGTIRTAAFKIVKKSDGKATLTLNPNEFLDPATLQRDLAKYGIPAKDFSGSFCSSDPAPAGFRRSCPCRHARRRAAAIRCAAHYYLRPGGHASGHRAELRLLPAHQRRAAGLLRAD